MQGPHTTRAAGKALLLNLALQESPHFLPQLVGAQASGGGAGALLHLRACPGGL